VYRECPVKVVVRTLRERRAERQRTGNEQAPGKERLQRGAQIVDEYGRGGTRIEDLSSEN
jgi:hypothetical protein